MAQQKTVLPHDICLLVKYDIFKLQIWMVAQISPPPPRRYGPVKVSALAVEQQELNIDKEKLPVLDQAEMPISSRKQRTLKSLQETQRSHMR